MDNSNETDVHSIATKALAEVLPQIKEIVNNASSVQTRISAATLLKEMYEATTRDLEVNTQKESVADELQKLHSLRMSEILTDDEFNKQKMKLLG